MINADYIVGLTDGEGCFYVNIRDRNHGNWIPKIETHYYIKLRKDDKSLLEEVKKFFGRGGVYFQNEKRANHTACYRFEMNSQKDISQIVIPFFKKHLLQSQTKRKAFRNFCKIFSLIYQKKSFTEKKLLKIRQLKSEMNYHGTRPVREIRSPGGNGN